MATEGPKKPVEEPQEPELEENGEGELGDVEEDEDDDDELLDFSFLQDPRDKVEEKPEEKSEVKAQEEPKEPKPAEEPKEPEPKEPEPAPVPQPPTPAPQEVPQQPAPQVDAAAQQAEMEQRALAKMETYFQLSDEEIERFTTEPEKVLPQMAARVMLRTVQTAVEAIKTLLPQVIEQHTRAQMVAQSAEEQFYTTWPQLKGREDARDVIVQHANFFRQMYPQATVEETVKNVGASVMVALGIQHGQPAPGPGAGQQPGGNGSQVVRRESLPPHKPAASTPPRELAPPTPTNVFERMALDDD